MELTRLVIFLIRTNKSEIIQFVINNEIMNQVIKQLPNHKPEVIIGFLSTLKRYVTLNPKFSRKKAFSFLNGTILTQVSFIFEFIYFIHIFYLFRYQCYIIIVIIMLLKQFIHFYIKVVVLLN